MSATVILCLSHYPDLFRSFRECVDKYEPHYRKILIRDGDLIDVSELNWHWYYTDAPTPFNFSRNLNIGWKLTEPFDVLLCGDDMKFGSQFVMLLKRAAYSDEKIGITTVQLHGQSPFVCCYFKRSIIDLVGPMDEQFDGYGSEDMDWCTRMEALGYRTQPVEGIVAAHAGGTSFYRRELDGTGPHVQTSADENTRKFKEKWAQKKS